MNKKRLIKIIVTIMVLAAVVLLSVGCSSDETTTVNTQNYMVSTGTISTSITGTGNLALSRTENLAFEMAGTVAEVMVTEGETVSEGQELVKLDIDEWEDQLNVLEKSLVSAQRTLTTKERTVTDAERTVADKEAAINTAERNVTSKEVAVSQAQLDLETAEYNLTQLDEVQELQEKIDNAEFAIKMATKVLGGELGGGLSGDFTYWEQMKNEAQSALLEYQSDMRELLDSASTTTSEEVAIQIAKYQLAVTKAQLSLEDTNIAVEDAKAAITDAEQAVEDAKSDLVDANLALEDAKDAVEEAQANLNDAKTLSPVITAPFDGFISSVKVEGGDEILKGTVALVIADPNLFSAEILVGEEDIFNVELGGSATVTLDALSDYTFAAEVTHISPTATVSSGVVNYSVTVNITSLQPITAMQSFMSQMGSPTDNRTMPEGMTSGNFTRPSGASPETLPTTTAAETETESVALKDGLSATVEITAEYKTDILIIPSKAITRQNQQYTVQVVNGDTTEARIITTGITDGNYTEVVSGLSEGEQVQITSASTTSSSSSSSSSSSFDTQRQIQSISGGGPSGGPPGGF